MHPPAHHSRHDETGVALLATLMALLLIGAIGAAMAALATVDFKTSVNHRSATRALMLADAGATHALALMRGPLGDLSYSDILIGSDGLPGTADDGVLEGFGLAASDALPDTGVVLGDGRYFVELVNDDGDPSGTAHTDDNYRLRARCRGVTRDGGLAEVGIALDAPAFPAIVSNGDLTIPGTTDVLGPCAGVHANGTLVADGGPTIDGAVSATGDVIVSGTIIDAAGTEVVPVSGASPMEVPRYDPFEFCDESVAHALRNGWLVAPGPPPDSVAASGGGASPWSWNAAENTYSLNGNGAVDGVYCVDGNVEVTGNAGSNGNPLAITILATGSVEVAGNPRIEAAHPDGVLIVAGGDVKISGNAAGFTPAYAGMIYAGSQCQVNGTPDVHGHILCYDGADPPGAADLTSDNKVNGTPTVIYDCTGERRRTMITSWWETRAE